MDVLSAIVLVAIKPKKQLCDARDVERKSIVRELQNAINQRAIDAVQPPIQLSSGEENIKPICRQGVSDDACVNLDAITPDYIVSLPVDSKELDVRFTDYASYQDSASRSVVRALHLGTCDG